MSVNSGLIDRIAKDLIYRPELVVIGSGDDGAVYRVPAGYDQVISTVYDSGRDPFYQEDDAPFRCRIQALCFKFQ